MSRTSPRRSGSNVGWYISQSQLLVVLGPEHAATIAADGLSKADVQRFVFEHARLPLGRLKLGGMWGMHDWPTWMQKATDDARHASPGALARRHLRHGGRRVGQALRRRAQLHVQPSGEPPDRPDSVGTFRGTSVAVQGVASPAHGPPAGLANSGRGRRPERATPRRELLVAWGLLVIAWLIAGQAVHDAWNQTHRPYPGFGVMENLLVGVGGLERGGLEPFDYVRTMDGRVLTSGAEIQAAVRANPPGTRFHYILNRGSRLVEADVPSIARTVRDFERFLLEGFADRRPLPGPGRRCALAEAGRARDPALPRLLPHLVLHLRALPRRAPTYRFWTGLFLTAVGRVPGGVDPPRAHLSRAPPHSRDGTRASSGSPMGLRPARPVARRLDSAASPDSLLLSPR